jgi:hypothetical protein
MASPDAELPMILRASLADVYERIGVAIRELPLTDFEQIAPQLRDCSHRMVALINDVRDGMRP